MIARPVVVLSVVAVAVSLAVVVVLAVRASGPPSRCGAGFVAIGARCCGEGQSASAGVCTGAPSACGKSHDVTSSGCVPRRARLLLAGGVVRIGPSDWEAQGVVAPRELHVGAFRLDRFEIDVARLGSCIADKRCPGSPPAGDPGRAAQVTLAQATSLCASEGGRIPTDDEWTFAAMGPAARRYPWGDTGAVCSRAAYGLMTGPCARDADGPDTVGSRPLGATPEGIDDLAGNLAEWTLTARGEPRLRGGSFSSRLATDLRGWSAGSAPTEGAIAGARCAYDP